mmetsp:Transcript_2760/g.7754  ORF Transcript_2760/g.7754 Transcript_2760/m.7754 type:complete len:213 (-) Transcript_2760:933-1571(-)
MAASDHTSCAQSCLVNLSKSLASASPCAPSTTPCTMSLPIGNSGALCTTFSCTTQSRQTCHRCRGERPSVTESKLGVEERMAPKSPFPRQMLSAQSRKNGLGHVPVVKLIQMESSSLRRRLSAKPRRPLLEGQASRTSEIRLSIASTSCGISVLSPAKPSNLNMFTLASQRKRWTASLKRAEYNGPARERPPELVSKPCLFASAIRLFWASP